MPKISKVQTTRIYKKVVIGFIAVAVVLLGLILYFSMSKTSVTVTIQPQERTSDVAVTIQMETQTEDTELTDTIYGYVTTTTVEGSKEFENTNEGEMAKNLATGTVTIYNNWSEVQPLAATTRLLTPDGILFRIRERVDVPAGGKLENVVVDADQKGETGNIEPTKFTIPGLWSGLQDKIYAESSEAMTGGLREAKVITKVLLDAAEAEIIEQLRETASTESLVDSDIEENKGRALDTALVLSFIDSGSSIAEGEIAELFTLEATATFVVVIVDEDELLTKALDSLRDSLEVGEQIESYKSSDLLFTVNNYDLDAKTASLNVSINVIVIPTLTHQIFDSSNLTGKNQSEISKYYENFDYVKGAEVSFSPFWVSRAPSLSDNIEIVAQ